MRSCRLQDFSQGATAHSAPGEELRLPATGLRGLFPESPHCGLQLTPGIEASTEAFVPKGSGPCTRSDQTVEKQTVTPVTARLLPSRRPTCRPGLSTTDLRVGRFTWQTPCRLSSEDRLRAVQRDHTQASSRLLGCEPGTREEPGAGQPAVSSLCSLGDSEGRFGSEDAEPGSACPLVWGWPPTLAMLCGQFNNQVMAEAKLAAESRVASFPRARLGTGSGWRPFSQSKYSLNRVHVPSALPGCSGTVLKQP